MEGILFSFYCWSERAIKITVSSWGTKVWINFQRIYGVAPLPKKQSVTQSEIQSRKGNNLWDVDELWRHRSVLNVSGHLLWYLSISVHVAPFHDGLGKISQVYGVVVLTNIKKIVLKKQILVRREYIGLRTKYLFERKILVWKENICLNRKYLLEKKVLVSKENTCCKRINIVISARGHLLNKL